MKVQRWRLRPTSIVFPFRGEIRNDFGEDKSNMAGSSASREPVYLGTAFDGISVATEDV